MADEIILNKVAHIERCLKRIREEYDENSFQKNFTKQDAIILNLQRACETALDIGMHIIRLKQLGLPQNSREVFVLLEEAKIIPAELSQNLQRMVGFRNIAIHEYTKINLEIVKNIVENHLEDFLAFNRLMLKIT